jgi:aryl-alcohol dehydrogenase-like predicted oxidoreductase
MRLMGNRLMESPAAYGPPAGQHSATDAVALRADDTRGPACRPRCTRSGRRASGASGRSDSGPLGGNATDPIWRNLDTSPFLAGCHAASGLQAAFRLAFCLPPVTRMAVGTSSPAHLRELIEATRLEVDENMVRRYAILLRARSALRGAASVTPP